MVVMMLRSIEHWPLFVVFTMSAQLLTPTAAYAEQDPPDTKPIETILPPQGHPKRLVKLHSLAERSYHAHQWQDACRFYLWILDEAGPEGLNSHSHAARAFFRCAESAFKAHEEEKVHAHLNRAEQLGLHSARHDVLRRKLVQRRYREKLGADDIEAAMALYEDYQRAGEFDEDERIWVGEKLAERARVALTQGEQTLLRGLLAQLKVIAPLNTEYRAIKSELEQEAQLLFNGLVVTGTAVASVVLLSLLSRWQGRSKVGQADRRSMWMDDDV